MSSNVEIILKAVDNASKALNDIEKELKDVEGAGNKGKAGIKGFSGALDDTIKSATGFSLSQIGVAAAIGATAKVVRDSIKDTVEYADNVRELNRLNGESSESNSKLIQVTDDLGLSMESLNTATTAAARQGIALSVGELQRMSAEFLSLEDPVKRNTYALEHFGKSGLEMIKVLEAGPDVIGAMSDSVSDMLVLTDEQVKAARELEIAQDNLNDAWAGVKTVLGNAVIPALTSFLGLMEDGIGVATGLATQQSRLSDVYADHSQDVAATAKTYEDYIAEMTRAYKANGMMVTGVGDSMRVYKTTGQEMRDVTDQFGLLTEAQYEQANALGFTSQEWTDYIDVMGAMQDSTRETGAATEEAAEKTKPYVATLEDIAKATAAARDRASEASDEFFTLAESLAGVSFQENIDAQIEFYDDLLESGKMTQETYNQVVENTLLGAGRITEVSIAEATARTEAELMVREGISLTADEYLLLPDIIAGVAADGVVSVGEMETAWINAGITSVEEVDRMNGIDLTEAAGEAQALLNPLLAISGLDPNKTFNYSIHVHTTGPIGLLGQGGFGNSDTIPFTEGGEPTYGASGLDFIVPPNHPNDSFGPIYAQSGEHVQVTPAGQSSSNSGNSDQLAAILSALNNLPRSIGLSIEQAMQRVSG